MGGFGTDLRLNCPRLIIEYLYCKQPQCLPRWAVTVGDSLNEEIAVKDDAGNKFGHCLFVPASLLADGLLGLLYTVVEFFF